MTCKPGVSPESHQSGQCEFVQLMLDSSSVVSGKVYQQPTDGHGLTPGHTRFVPIIVLAAPVV